MSQKREYLIKFEAQNYIRKASLIKIEAENIKNGFIDYVRNIVAESGNADRTLVQSAPLFNPRIGAYINGMDLLCDEEGLLFYREITCCSGYSAIAGTAVATAFDGDDHSPLNLEEVIELIKHIEDINVYASMKIGTGDVDLSDLIKATNREMASHGINPKERSGR